MKTWEDIQGWFDWQRIYDDWAKEAPENAIIIEIGSWYGRSTCYGAKVFGESGKNLRFIAVDHCVGALKGADPTAHLTAIEIEAKGTIAGDLHRNILECGGQHLVILLITDSVRASSLFSDESVQYVLVDGDHKAGAVLRDLSSWWPKLIRGGEMAGHDYYYPPVKETVDKFFGRACPSSRSDQCWEVQKL